MTITHIKDLTPDPQNARRHNPRNVGMIERALGEVGAARSIVVDEDGVILAGNATVEAAAAAGITRTRIIDTDGEEIIAVRRTGLTPEQKVKLALFDNRASELADWEPDVLAAIAAQDIDLSALFTAEEWTGVAMVTPNGDEWADALGSLPDGDRAPFQQMTFTVSDQQAETIKRALDAAKDAPFGDTGNENSNGNALARLAEAYLG